VACPLKAGIFQSMVYVTTSDVTNVSTAGNDVLCGFSLIVISCNSREIVGRCVFCLVFPEAV
jgi:hypothetical protein